VYCSHVEAVAYRRRRLPTRYTSRDVALEQSGKADHARVARLSVAHLYKLRRSVRYRKMAARWEPTQPSEHGSARVASRIRADVDNSCASTACNRATGRSEELSILAGFLNATACSDPNDNTWVARPARTNETAAGPKAPRCGDIIRRVANHEAVCRHQVMLACRAPVKKDIRFLAEARLAVGMGENIRADNERALYLQVCRECREPGLEVRH
jgi:hypothetical protein